MKIQTSFLLTLICACGLATLSAEDLKISEFTFKLSDKWTDKGAEGMRAAQLTYDAKGDAETDPVAVFFLFPGGGGGVEANIARWKTQFEGGKPDKEERIELPKGGAMVVLSGTFLDTMPGSGPFAPGPKQAKPGYKMLAAIFMDKEGSAVVVKLTAPEAIADEVRAPLEEMLKAALQ